MLQYEIYHSFRLGCSGLFSVVKTHRKELNIIVKQKKKNERKELHARFRERAHQKG